MAAINSRGLRCPEDISVLDTTVRLADRLPARLTIVGSRRT